MSLNPTTRRLLLAVVKLLALVIVVGAVWHALRSDLQQLDAHDWQFHWPWLFASGVLYLCGYQSMAWYWRQALFALGQHPQRLTTHWAYWAGHLGKYVPGKAFTIVLRAALLAGDGISPRATVVSMFLETMTAIATGALLAVGLSIVLLQLSWPLVILAVAVMLAASVPTLPPVARRLAGIQLRWKRETHEIDEAAEEAAEGIPPSETAVVRFPDPIKLDGITLRLLIEGWLASLVCWCLLAVSLWACLRGVGVSSVHPVNHSLLLLGTVTWSVVAGFVSMLPGGLGVRDAVVVGLLAEPFGTSSALIAAIVLRVVWLLSEVAICVILYLAERHARKG